MRIKNIIKMFSAALVLAMVVGSSSNPMSAIDNEKAVVYAAEVTSTLGQTKTFPVNIDPMKFNLAGSWRYLANAEGNPDIQIAQNAPNMYTLVMYEGTAIIMDFNNPVYCRWYDQIGFTNDYLNDPVYEVVSCMDEIGLIDGTDCSNEDMTHQMFIEAIKPGTVMTQVSVINCDPYTVHDDFEPVEPISLAVIVVPRIPGAQEPTYSHGQRSWKELQDAGLM